MSKRLHSSRSRPWTGRSDRRAAGVVSPSAAPRPAVLDEAAALRAGRARCLAEVRRLPWHLPNIQRINEEIARLEREKGSKV